ncbi:organic cation/carnitine transporter 2-like [Tubulanus polymorphus]|uniref:organic cation/carnitine transporter 2-like n=1 Tax=Tubulanus polymorphus TaxID=672921 RepID=UPI003DA3BEB1
MSFIWCCNSFQYYGMILGTSVMVGNRFVNFILGAVVELPSNLVTHFMLIRFGRRPTMILAYSLTGVLLVAANLIPEKYGSVDLVPLLTTLNTLGKFFSTAAFNSIFIHTTEIFPTNFRNRAFGIASTCARIGSMVAPLTLYASDDAKIPGLIFGGVGFLAALLVLPLPETKGVPMPQKISDVQTNPCYNCRHFC